MISPQSSVLRPLLSILTPSLPERVESRLLPLWRRLQEQITRDAVTGQVEHLVFLDNRCRNVGEKRTTMLAMARGRYLAFVDDDDDVSDDYIKQLVGAITLSQAGSAPDVITFKQRAIIEHVEGICDWQLGHPNEPFNPAGFRRPPWHSCAWRTDLAQRFPFPPTNAGEDWAWAQQANAAARTSHHIPAVLHTYRYDPAVSAATPGVSFFKPRLTWREIPGWFDFPEFYDHAVATAREGAIFVEVGTWLGQSTAYLLGAIQNSGKSIALRGYDTFVGSVSEPEHLAIVARHGGSILEAARANMAGACGPDGPTVLVQADSAEAAGLHADGTVDFCFIDADHTEPGVRRDILAWLPKIKPGGILAGHDIDCLAVYTAVTATLGSIYHLRKSGRCWLVQIPEDIGSE